MHAPGSSFRRVSAFAGVAAIAGISLTAASPAAAATDADCTVSNTVDAATGTQADIQTLLSASTPIVCLSGTFLLTSTLTANGNVTMHGLADAVLDGNNAVQILHQFGGADVTVENIRFTRAQDLIDGGGAIFGYTITARNSTFDNNRALYGGAIYGDNVTVEDSVFEYNQADWGGAIFSSGPATAIESTFTGNTANFVGAILSYSVVTSTASTFDQNGAGQIVGAIATPDDVAIENSTFFGNGTDDTSDGAGAIYAGGGSISQSTFVNNLSAGTTGGQAATATAGPMTLYGNIFASSISSSSQLDTTGTDFSDLGGNLFTTSQVTETALPTPDASDQFDLPSSAIFTTSALADNGGETETIAISPTGPAVDAVPTGGSPATDQRGIARTGLSDAGAFEIGAATTPGAPTLAATGFDGSWLFALAAGLLGVGVGALRLSGRRTRS